MSSVSWDDLAVGQIIRYRHHNRSQRLSGRTPMVRRARIREIWHPKDAARRLPQIRLAVLNRDGTVAARYANHALFYETAIDDVVAIVSQPAPDTTREEGQTDRG